MSIKMFNKAGHLTKSARYVFEGAQVVGPFDEVLRISVCDDRKMKTLYILADELDINVVDMYPDAYVYIHWLKNAFEEIKAGGEIDETAEEEMQELVPELKNNECWIKGPEALLKEY